MKSGQGSLNRKRTRPGSTTSTAATLSFMTLFAVVELDTLAQDELLDESVLRQAPRFGQARRHGVAGHGLYERVVQRVEDHERRGDARSLGRVEPGGGKRDVDPPGHLAFGRGGNRSGSDGRNQEEE